MNEQSSAHQWTMRVVAKELVAQGVVALTLADAGGSDVPVWDPGAHIELKLDEGITRQYSLCGDPTDRTQLTVAVLRDAAGRGGSIRVHDVVEVDATIDVVGPRNLFPFVDRDRYLFIAGGIGITPLLPMLRSAAEAGREWRLLYGGRTRDSMAFADELTEQFPGRVTLQPQDECGQLDLAAALDTAGAGTVVYCCGPEALINAVEAQCHARGLECRVERFAPKEQTSQQPAVGFDVELTRSGRVISVGETESILDAVLRASPVLVSRRNLWHL